MVCNELSHPSTYGVEVSNIGEPGSSFSIVWFENIAIVITDVEKTFSLLLEAWKDIF